VMPRSRSRSLESMARSSTRWLSRTEPDCFRSASTRVVFPWSTWAMIAILRSFIGSLRGSVEQALSRTGISLAALIQVFSQLRKGSARPWARPGLIWYCGSPQKRGARHHPESERPTLRQEPWPAARNGLDLNGAGRHRSVVPRLPEAGTVPLPLIAETAMADDITSGTAQTVGSGQHRGDILRCARHH